MILTPLKTVEDFVEWSSIFDISEKFKLIFEVNANKPNIFVRTFSGTVGEFYKTIYFCIFSYEFKKWIFCEAFTTETQLYIGMKIFLLLKNLLKIFFQDVLC